MSNWSGEKTVLGAKYSLWEMHLQGLYRGIKLQRSVGGNETVVYYFLGDPHNTNSYTTNSGKFYKQALETLSNLWSVNNKVPEGNIGLAGGITANYRGPTMTLNVRK